MSKKFFIFVSGMLVVVGILAFLYSSDDEELKLIPRVRVVQESSVGGSTEVRTGASTKTDPGEAVKEALGKAMSGRPDKQPDLAIVFVTSGSDMKAILSHLRQALGKTKIYGGTSDSRGVMTNEGFFKAAARPYVDPSADAQHALAVMTVSSKEVLFGVGSARRKDHTSVQDASKAAMLQAIASAGKQPQDTPRLVLVTLPRSFEEEAIEGIVEVVGPNTALVGGTAGGPKFEVFGENEVYDNGISLLAIYTDLPMGWIFEGGFDVKDQPSGVVTKVDGNAIVEIENRPALEVYDGWLDGHISRLATEVKDPKSIRTLLTLHPLYRKYTSPEGQDHFLFSHPWPKDDSVETKIIMTSTKIKVGERIYVSSGSWQTFLNRIGNLPIKAKVAGGIGATQGSIFGIGYICAGVMGVIPESERAKMSFLINHNNNNAPFIAPFTWGEQGQFPGIGNKHGNLLTGFVVVGGSKSR